MTVFVNNKNVIINSKITLLQLCDSLGLSIPRFCFHKQLSVAANCRMCLVQLEDSTKPIASCAVTVNQNLSIITNSSFVKKARESILEFLLINHPLDCPICDQAGECDLQDQSLLFGTDRGRFFEKKRAVSDFNLGATVKTFMSRCIHCTRCIRFAAEISNSNELGLLGRGNSVKVSTFLNISLNSIFSGNLADICPVGALTSKPYAFSARPWELKGFYCIDIFDTFGSNFKVDTRGVEIIRILPSVQVNRTEHWITDKSRLFFDSLGKQRLLFPAIAVKQNLITKLAWSQIFYLVKTRIAQCLLLSLITHKLRFASNFSPMLSIGHDMGLNEAFAFKTITNFLPKFDIFINAQQISCVFKPIFRNIMLLQNKVFAKKQKNFLIVGSDLGLEAPTLGLQVNKLANKQDRLIFTIVARSDSSANLVSAGLSGMSFFLFIRGRVSICQFFSKNDLKLLFGGSTLFRRDCVDFLQNKSDNLFGNFSTQLLLPYYSQISLLEQFLS